MFKKKWLGIPMPIIAGILTLALLAGGTFAGIMLTREIPSTVSVVVPYEMTIWEDEACTIELVDLPFGKVMAGGNTDSQTFYLKNEGELEQYIALSQNGLDGKHLALNWNGVTETSPPDSLIFQYVLTELIITPEIPGIPESSEWVNSGQTLTADINGAASESIDYVDTGNKLGEYIDTTSLTQFELFSHHTFSAGDIIRIDEELMLVTSVSSPQVTVERGYDGTTKTTHVEAVAVYIQETIIIPLDTELACSDGTAFSVGDAIKVDTEEMVITAIAGNTLTVTRGTLATHISGTAIFVWETTPAVPAVPAVTEWVKSQTPLAPDTSMAIALFLSADSGAEKGDISFTTIVKASDVPY